MYLYSEHAGFRCLTVVAHIQGLSQLSLHRIHIPSVLVLLLISLQTKRAQQQQHSPLGAKNERFSLVAYPPVPPLTTSLIPPFKTHSCLCLRGAAEMKGNMQCAASDCELCGVIRGKFTGLVCILNTL